MDPHSTARPMAAAQDQATTHQYFLQPADLFPGLSWNRLGLHAHHQFKRPFLKLTRNHGHPTDRDHPSQPEPASSLHHATPPITPARPRVLPRSLPRHRSPLHLELLRALHGAHSHRCQRHHRVGAHDCQAPRASANRACSNRGPWGGDFGELVIAVVLLVVVWPLCSIFCIVVWRSAVGVGRGMVTAEEEAA